MKLRHFIVTLTFITITLTPLISASYECFTEGTSYFESWVTDLVEKAQKGNYEMVTIPLIYKAQDGFVSPETFLGDSPWSAPKAKIWIKPIYSNVKEPEYDAKQGLIIAAEGVFSGNTHNEQLAEGKNPDWHYNLKEFLIFEYRILEDKCKPINPIPSP